MSCMLLFEKFQLVFGRFGFFQPFIFLLEHFPFCVLSSFVVFGCST